MAPKCYICGICVKKNISLFRIPDRNDEYSDRCGLWLKVLDEKPENMHKIRVCSIHFIKNKPAKSSDVFNLDWIPNQNLGRFSKNLKRTEYHFHKRQKNLSVTNPHKVGALTQNVNVSAEYAGSNDESTCKNVANRGNSLHMNFNDDESNVQSLCSTENLVNDDRRVPNFDFEGDTSNRKVSSNSSDVIVGRDQVGESSDISDQLLRVSITNEAEKSSKKMTLNSVLPTNKNVEINTKSNIQTAIPEKKRKIEIISQKFFFPKDIQTDLSITEIDSLFQYYKEAVEERDALLLKISTLVIDYDFFKENDKKSRFYTGLATWTLLKNLFETVESFLPSHSNCKLNKFQMFVLTLMKLRLNLSFTDLGYRFNVDEKTASRYFYRCIFILFKLFKNSKLLRWPNERNNLLLNVPSYFQSTFKEQITIIVDCFEIFLDRPSLLRAAAQGFSQYKHHITLKYLIGISITGVILFVSIGYGGRASDKEVVNKSGFLDNLQEGDVVLGDKGFLIENEVQAKDAFLKTPSFVKKGMQLDPKEVEQSRDLARVRIHVERIICVLREKFNICSDQVRMSIVSKQNDLFDNDLMDKIVFVCSCLVNVCPTVVKNDFEM